MAHISICEDIRKPPGGGLGCRAEGRGSFRKRQKEDGHGTTAPSALAQVGPTGFRLLPSEQGLWRRRGPALCTRGPCHDSKRGCGWLQRARVGTTSKSARGHPTPTCPGHTALPAPPHTCLWKCLPLKLVAHASGMGQLVATQRDPMDPLGLAHPGVPPPRTPEMGAGPAGQHPGCSFSLKEGSLASLPDDLAKMGFEVT